MYLPPLLVSIKEAMACVNGVQLSSMNDNELTFEVHLYNISPCSQTYLSSAVFLNLFKPKHQ
jgi:carbon monoxide dehydrogenase subunit G